MCAIVAAYAVSAWQSPTPIGIFEIFTADAVTLYDKGATLL